MYTDEAGDNGNELTPESAAPAFEHLLSLEEDPQDAETPPVQKSPEPDPDAENESSTEQDDAAEGKSTDDEETDATEEQPTDVLYPVRINGEETMVTLDELRKGYSRQKDYTQKTQEVSELRRQYEAQIPVMRDAHQQVANYLTQLEQVVTEATPQEPDWARVQAERPEEFPALWAEWQVHKDRLNEIRSQREQAIEVVRRDQSQARQTYLEEQKSKLLAAVPEWKDSKVATAEKAKLIGYAKEMGYSPEDLALVDDHKVLLVLRDAMRYREQQKKKPAITERIEKVKAATPGASESTRPATNKVTEARKRLAKTGRQDDFAAALEEYLND